MWYSLKLHQFAEKLELRGYSKRTIPEYCNEIERFCKYLEREESIKNFSDIKPAHISTWHASLQFGKWKNNKHLTSATVQHRLSCLKTFFAVMFQERLLSSDYAHLIVVPKTRHSIPRNIPDEQGMAALLESISPDNPVSLRDRCLLELLYASGLRISEALDITLDTVNIADKTIFIKGKGAKDRVIPVGDWVMPWLIEYMESSRPALVSDTQTDLLFVSNRGNPLFESNVCWLIKKYATRAESSLRISPHGFRHACATHMLRGGADIRYIQELLGHSNLSTTQIYTRVDISSLKKAHKKFHPRERDHGRT